MSQKFLKQRLPLGSKFEELIIKFLETFEQLQIINTGALKEHLEKDLNTDIWKQDQFKKHKPLLMLRWLPDLMIINASKEISLFADVKFMYTPIYLDTLPKQISENTGIEIKKHEIGNIEREAYDSYISWINGGAKVAIISLATFHPNLILSEFADQVEILFRDERERNHFSSGSTTPRVNIHLSKMKNFFEFIEDNLLKEKIDEQRREKFMQYCKENFSFIGLPRSIAASSAQKVQSELSSITKRNLRFLEI
jgi:hypothetical protein